MKKYLLFATLGFLLCLVACYEVNEVVDIKEDGSGTYAAKMDMSGLLELAASMGSEEDFKKEGMDKVMDTVINFSSFSDTASGLTEQQKKLFRTGKMHMIMNMAAKQFVMDMDFKFSNPKELEMLMSGEGLQGMGKSLQAPVSGDSSARALGGLGELETGGQFYDIKVEKNRITKSINKARFDSLMANPQMQQMQQLAGSGMEILFTTTIRFPRAVKSSDNALVKLSNDKKTATIKYDMLDMFSNPDKYGFVIEY